MPSRVFLPLNTPLLPSVVDRILPESGSGPLELESLWMMVPTRQSGRRLRESLARAWRERGGTALLSLEVHPPAYLLQPGDSTPLAHPFDWMDAWQQVLRNCQPGDLPALFPSREEPWTPETARETGQRLQQVRNELLESGLDINKALSRISSPAEKERWQELATLESAYRNRLADQGVMDPVDAKARALQQFVPPSPVKRLILAGVPDPSPAVVTRLKSLEEERTDLQFEVWIHGEASDQDAFDDWGRPKDLWRTRFLGREEEPEGWVELLPDSNILCSRAAELLRDQPPLPDLALGLVDETLSAPLAHRFRQENRPLYLPNPSSLAEQEWVRILTALHEHRQHRDPESLRALLRFGSLYQDREEPSTTEVLAAWDRYAASSYPESAEAVDQTLTDPFLLPVWKQVKRWLEATRPSDLLDALKEHYQARLFHPEHPSDRYQLRQITAVADVLQEALRREQAGQTPSIGTILRVLKEQSVDPLRVENALTAEGWLELPYHPAPDLFLLGLREGVVPPPLKPDPFLSSGIREELGLKSDRDWIARDAYLFHTLLSCREAGHIRVLLAKRDAQGNPNLPSRFLFSCPREEMLSRARMLFRDPPSPGNQPAPSPGILLKPEHIQASPPGRLSVSAINQYLTCPTRFYFSRILGMETLDDMTHYPDAAAFGSLIHRVLERLVASGCDTLRTWDEGIDEHLPTEMAVRFGRTEGLASAVFMRSARARLHAAGEIHARLREEGWKTLALEQPFSRDCMGMEITGTIDRIDIHPEKGLLLLDAKTSDTAKKPSEVHLGPARAGRESIQVEVKGKVRQWANLQLPLYQWLIQTSDLPGTSQDSPLHVAYLNLPKAVTESGLEIWHEEPHLVKQAESCLQAVVAHIQAGDWHPTTPIVAYDAFKPLLHHGSDWVPSGWAEPCGPEPDTGS